MKKIFLMLCIIHVACNSNENKVKDLSGTFEDTQYKTITKVKYINDTLYEITDPSGKFTISAKRVRNTLLGTFQGRHITCEFNPTYDTIITTTNGRLSFIATRLKD